MDESPIIEKLHLIESFIKVNIDEKKKYFTQSRYEILTFDEKIGKSEGFNQQNFQNLINRCRVLIKASREDKLFAEKLKQEILILENEKKAIIEKTKSTIEELKIDNLKLIEKIENSRKEKLQIEKEKNELLKKHDEVVKKTIENNQLKLEMEKSKMNWKKETNRVFINKDKQIEVLWEKVKYNSKFEKELSKEQKEKYIYKNGVNELKVEIHRLNTVRRGN
jgi:hypothetical protein